MNLRISMWIRPAICFLLLTGLASPSAAQTISNVVGTLAHGNTVTIQGQNFGTRTIGNTMIFDNMESGSFNPRWSNTSDMPIVNQSRHPNSQKAAYHNFRNWDNHGYFTGGSNDPGPWFAQYWFKLGNNFDWGDLSPEGQAGANLNNVKFFRMWETGSTDENFSMAVHTWENNAMIGNEYIGGSFTLAGYAEGGFMQRWTKNVWHCFQFEFKDSSVRGHDGVIRWWVDGKLAFEATDMMTREDSAAYKRPYILGFFNSVSDPFADDNDFWIDDAFIDTSWARVELGNASTYGSCTHRELQIPTAWNANGQSVTVNVNQGSFSGGTPAYLFVVASNGQASAGFPVVVGSGGTSDTISPVASILSPATNGNSYEVSVNGAVNITGSASDNVGITRVEWSGSLGGSGVAVGTTSWSISGLELPFGTNRITVSAFDAAGNVGTAFIDLGWHGPGTPPSPPRL